MFLMLAGLRRIQIFKLCIVLLLAVLTMIATGNGAGQNAFRQIPFETRSPRLCDACLLVPKRFQGIDFRRPACWNITSQ